MPYPTRNIFGEEILKFSREYTEYWIETVDKSIDGLKIAGANEAAQLIETLKIDKVHSVVDVGCSYGRMFNVVKDLGKEAIGIDPDSFAVEKASELGYSKVLVATAENTKLENESADMVFCWASFDVVNQLVGLLEFNRILKVGGHALITGKNWDYPQDDSFGLLAEKRAYAKKFPNNFTDLETLIEILPSIGFELSGLLLFHKRGDMGEVKFSVWDSSRSDIEQSYEYLIHLVKIGPNVNPQVNTQFSFKYSKTAETLASKLGMKSVVDFLLEEG